VLLITPYKISCHVSAGAQINDVVVAAVDLAVERRLDVEFEFNGKIWEVPYVSLLTTVHRLNETAPSGREAQDTVRKGKKG
jgi:hypothetical protein